MGKSKFCVNNSLFKFIESVDITNSGVIFNEFNEKKWLYLEYLLSEFSGDYQENIVLVRFVNGESFSDDEWVSILDTIIFMSSIHRNINANYFANLIKLLMTYSRFQNRLNGLHFHQNPLLYYALLGGPYYGDEVHVDFDLEHSFIDKLEKYIQDDDFHSMNNFIETNSIPLSKLIEIRIGTTRKYNAYLISYSAFYKSQKCFNSLLSKIKCSTLDQKEILKQARLFAVMGGNTEAFTALQREEEMTIQNDWIIAALSFRQLNFLKYFLGEEKKITIEIDKDEDFLCSIIALFSIRMDFEEESDTTSVIYKELNIDKMMESAIKCGQLGFIKFLSNSSPIGNPTYYMIESTSVANLDILKFFLTNAVNESRITVSIITSIIDKSRECSNEDVLEILQECTGFNFFQTSRGKISFIYQEQKIETCVNFKAKAKQRSTINIIKEINKYFRRKSFLIWKVLKSLLKQIDEKLKETLSDETHRTPLIQATLEGNSELALEHIEDKDIDINFTLLCAVKSKMKEIIIHLLTKLPKGYINFPIFEGLTLLDLSFMDSDISFAEFLLNEGAVVSKYSLIFYIILKNSDVMTLSKLIGHCTEILDFHLAICISMHRIDMMEELFPYAIVKDSYIILRAIQLCSIDIFHKLIMKGYSINTILHNDPNILNALIELKLDSSNRILNLESSFKFGFDCQIGENALDAKNSKFIPKRLQHEYRNFFLDAKKQWEILIIIEKQCCNDKNYGIVWSAIFKNDYDMAINILPDGDSSTKMQLCLFMIKRFITSRDYDLLENLRKKIGNYYFRRCMSYKIPYKIIIKSLNPELPHWKFYSFLILAVLQGDIKIVELIAKHSNIIEELPTGENALFFAAHLKYDDFLKRLLQLAGRVDKDKLPRHPEFHPVIEIITKNRPHCLRMLLKKGYSPNDTVTLKDSFMNLVSYCGKFGKKECLYELLAFCAKSEFAPLHRIILEKCLLDLNNFEKGNLFGENFTSEVYSKHKDNYYQILRDDFDKLKLFEQYVKNDLVIKEEEKSIILFAANHRKWIAFDYLVKNGYAQLKEGHINVGLAPEEVSRMIIYCLAEPQGIETLHKHRYFDSENTAFFEDLKVLAKDYYSPIPISRIEEIKNEVLRRKNP